VPDPILDVEVSETGVAWLRLARPEKKNAMNRELLHALIAAFESFREDDRIRCIVTTGAGDAYSAGLDLHDLKDKWARKRPWNERGALTELVTLVRSAPQVTVAAINGHCLGGGLALVNAHDLAVASDRASLGLPEIIRGSFGNVATATLFQTGIPFKKAFYLQLTGRRMSGEEAERIGLVSTVVPHAELEPFVRGLADEIASRNPVALEHAKIAAYQEMHQDFAAALRTDELVAHRMRVYTDPLADVDGYLRARKGEDAPDDRT
jgi:enoyl-CoA hydratase/carnithine racemase